MKSITKVSIVLFLLGVLPLFAQKKPVGNYILVKIKSPKEIETPFLPTTFTKEGKILLMDFPFGTWKLEAKKVYLTFKKDDFNGLYSIKKKSDLLILQNDKYTLTYQKYNPEDNDKLPILGVWKQQNSLTDTYVKFALHDTVVSVKTQIDITETSKGTWLYLPKTNTIMIFGFMDELRGNSKLQSYTKNSFTLLKDTLKMAFTREKEIKPKFLSFTDKDFPEDIDDSGKLPWSDWYDFQNISHIKYLRKEYLKDIGVFKVDTIVEKISVTDKFIDVNRLLVTKNDSISIKKIRKGGLENTYNRFFPRVDIGPYRVVKKEEITVPAGTFNCTVVEGTDYDILYKYWLIDKKPGIFAKIIVQKTEGENIDYFFAFDLMEIN